MKVTFQHPQTGTNNPLLDFQPSNPDHYRFENELGVYIYGLRAMVNGVFKFIPLVVGQGQLHERLYVDHYMGKFANPLAILLGSKILCSGDAKELWDFSNSFLTIQDLKKIYEDIKVYDSALGKRNKLELVVKLKHLVFFQNSNFFHLKHDAKLLTNQNNIKTEQSVEYLINMINKGFTENTDDIIQHISKILLSLNCFRDRFYFVYASKREGSDLSDEQERESIEKATKKHLKSINLYTTADARKGKEISIQIDLTKIQNELVNVGNHSYNDSEGNYIKHLIIK
jgi:hypothetical protein